MVRDPEPGADAEAQQKAPARPHSCAAGRGQGAVKFGFTCGPGRNRQSQGSPGKRPRGSGSSRKPGGTRPQRGEGPDVRARRRSPLPAPRAPGGRRPGRLRRRLGHKEEMGPGADGEAAPGAGPPRQGSGPLLAAASPASEAAPTFLQAQDVAGAPRGPETLPARPSPACNPHLVPTAARAHTAPRSARVYLRPRPKRWLRRWRRLHGRSLGPRHAAAKFPNMDSSVRLEMFGGRRVGSGGEAAEATMGADSSGAAPRG